MTENICKNCKYLILTDELFCEWVCQNPDSRCYDEEMEFNDSCGAFRRKQKNPLSESIQKAEIIKKIRLLGGMNIHPEAANAVEDPYQNGYIDALSDIIHMLYEEKE